ncbi:MAG: ATP-binding protein [Hyphomicrobiaceae bacterium]
MGGSKNEAVAHATGRRGDVAAIAGTASLRRLAQAVLRLAPSPRRRRYGALVIERWLLPLVLTGGAASLLGLMMVPHPVGPAHLLLAAGIAILLGGAQWAIIGTLARRQQPMREQRHTQMLEALERRLEKLQDVHWQISETDVRYRDLLDVQSDIILRRDDYDRLTYVNQAFEAAFGLAADDVLGTAWARRVVESEGASAAPLTTRDHDRRRRYVELLDTTGGQRWIDWDEHLVASSEGSGFEVQAVGRDVTEDRRLAAALAEARDQAETANRAKSRFLATMSHEIRTPMNGILGMTGLIRGTDLTEEQRTYANAIDQSARALLILIDEILDFSKIEAGKLVLNDSEFSLLESAQSVVELLAPRAHEKGLELSLSVAPVLEAPVRGDEARVRQILLNLLSNAVKFTDHGGVTIAVDAKPVPTEGAALAVEISVSDTGIGLSGEDMARLFTEFEQAETALRRQQGGTGLGLAITRRLVMAMEGDITVASTPGNGTTFTARFVLAVAQPGAAAEREAVCAHEDGGRHAVLLACGHPLERAGLARMLRAGGHVAEEAELADAVDAVIAASAAGCPFDRIIVDVSADPVWAGRILKEAKTHSSADVVGLVTVNVLARSGLEGFRRQGFECYLVRPVRSASLIQQIVAPLAKVRSTEAVSSEKEPGKAQAPITGGGGSDQHARLRVLLVEDNEINALLARRVLELAGCAVVHARDGHSGVARAVAAFDGTAEGIDIVLMDIFMPGLDGVSAAKEIREAHAQWHVRTEGAAPARCPPIVALTANAFPEDRDRYLAEGLDDYLAKPFDTEDLAALLERWCPRPGAAHASAAQLSASG